jgi:hypothetical protein
MYGQISRFFGHLARENQQLKGFVDRDFKLKKNRRATGSISYMHFLQLLLMVGDCIQSSAQNSIFKLYSKSTTAAQTAQTFVKHSAKLLQDLCKLQMKRLRSGADTQVFFCPYNLNIGWILANMER